MNYQREITLYIKFSKAKIQAIHKAIETGNLRAVKLLADRKKVALCRDARGLSPLHKAIVFGRTDIAKYLVRNYPQSVNAMDQVRFFSFSFQCDKFNGYFEKKKSLSIIS